MTLTEFSHSVGGFAAVGRMVDVRGETISRVARGVQVPKPDLAVRLVVATKGAVTLDELYGVPLKWRK